MVVKEKPSILGEIRDFVNSLDEDNPASFCPCCQSVSYLKEKQCWHPKCNARTVVPQYTHCCNSGCHPERWK